MNPAIATPSLPAKTLLVGKFSVGKTNLLVRYCDGTLFGDGERAFETRVKTTNIQGKNIQFCIWDTAGTERLRTVTPLSYKGCRGIIFCYAVNDRESFEDLDYWMDQVNQHGGEDACKILVATKCDLPDHVVTADEGRRKAAEWGIDFFETSTNLGLNVNNAFESLARAIKVKFLDGQAGNNANNNIGLNNNNKNNEKTGCCS